MTRLQQALAEKGRPLIGTGVSRWDPVFVEMAAETGFEMIWVDVEHGSTTYADAGNLIRLASGLGMLSLVRIGDNRRETVLKHAENGPDILLLSMGNSPEVIEGFCDHALYAPLGKRGFMSGTRAVGYALRPDIAIEQARVNAELTLMSQIETLEAVERTEELCSVERIAGFLIGPGDLSASMGHTGQIRHPEVMAAIERAVTTAKANGKLIGMVWSGPDLGYWAARGADFFISGGDIGCFRMGLTAGIEEARAALGIG
jgi:4-hydroxy-2-oxoheptanedioate aldolase